MPAAVLVASFGALSASSRAEWSGASCGEFTAHGDVSPAVTADVALRLQQYQLVLETLFPDLAPRSRDRLSVYVLKRGVQDLPIPGAKGIAGIFLPRPTGNYIVVDPRDATEAVAIVTHEYAHYAISLRFPDPPLWFAEGIAEFLENAHFESGKVGIHVSRRNLLGLRYTGEWIPLRDLLTADETSKARNERPYLFYAESWALVHFVLAGHPERKEGMFRFVGSGSQRFSEAAFREAFGASVEDVERDLKEYIRRDPFPEPSVPGEPGRSGLTITYLHPTKAEADALLGTLLLQFGEDGASRSIDMLRRAARGENAPAQTWSALGEAASLLSRHEEAESALRKAVDLDPSDFRGFYRFGVALLARARQVPPADRVPMARRAREKFRGALALRPDHLESHQGVALSCIGDPEALEEGLAAVTKVSDLAPYALETRVIAARLRIGAGRFEEADADLEAIRTEAARTEALESTRRLLVAGMLLAAEELAATGKPEKAIELLEKVAAIPPPEDQRADVRKAIEKARRVYSK